MAAQHDSTVRSSRILLWLSLLCALGFWRHRERIPPQTPLARLANTLSVTEGLIPPTENVTLRRRGDDYSCDENKPCSNGACCGENGFCGYGPKYCGDGCKSNCDATAECGENAKEPGKECPLKTCCSEFGFVCCETKTSRATDWYKKAD